MRIDYSLWARRLRSALFLTCLTSIASSFGLLDGFDALALKFLPDEAKEHQAQSSEHHIDTIVLGITTDFYDTELGGRTPIDRDRLQVLIKSVLAAYPAAKVIAIDYDLSPGGNQHCVDGDNTTSCAMKALEADQQARFDKFLTQDLKHYLGNRKISVILVNPLPPSDDSVPQKNSWQSTLSNSGVRFGDYSLLSHDWFGTIVKHIPVKPKATPCSTSGDVTRTFAAVVNDALACMSSNQPTTGKETNSNGADSSHQSEKVALINFGEARKAVFYCPLWDWDDVTQNCQRRLRLASSNPDSISVVFIGASYGQEDLFRTPLGDQYGVEIHAYSAYSLLHPVRGEESFKLFAFVIDIVFGLLSALFFDYLWEQAAKHPKYSIRRKASVIGVFLAFLVLVWGGVWSMPTMLDRGIWMNPFLILIGFFIDSYQASIEKLTSHEHSAQPDTIAGRKSWAHEFFGGQAEGRPLVASIDLRALRAEAWLQLLYRIVIYWSIVAYAGYLVLVK